MKKIIVCGLISFVWMACSNSANEKSKTVDTTIIGSDNPHPAPDTTGINKKPDSSGK
jgi:hypothetical protein